MDIEYKTTELLVGNDGEDVAQNQALSRNDIPSYIKEGNIHY